jgi:hypothetical protein
MLGSAEAETFTSIGAGNASCGTWTANRRVQVKSMDAETWVLGFLSGIGYAGNGNPLANMDAEGVWAWIDKYCSAYPISTIIIAAEIFAGAHPR